MKNSHVKEAISYFKRIRQYDAHDVELEITRNTLAKLDLDFSAYCRCIEDEYSKNLSVLRTPEWFLENRFQLFDVWKDEEALSDNLASLFFQVGIIKKNSMLRSFMGLIYPIHSLDEFELVNITREPSYKVGDVDNRGDILIRLSKSNKGKQILIEHKIYHNLLDPQLKKYQQLSLAEDTDLIILSSKDTDFKVSDNFKKTLPMSSQKRIHHVTHLSLLRILLKEIRDNSQNYFGFMVKWLFEIVCAFRSQKCIVSELNWVRLFCDDSERY